MRVRTIPFAIALAVLALAAPVFAQAPGAGNSVPGEIIVTFTPGSSANVRAEAHKQAGGSPRAEIASTGTHLVAVGAGNETAAIARYRGNPNVRSAEPNYIRSIPTPTAHGPGSEVIPGDFLFGEQYALHNTGQLFVCIAVDFCLFIGTPDADIDAPEAWAFSTGNPNIKVAVIDSGIDYNHPDLAANYAGGYDFIFNDADPMDDHGHGTHVAGTIAALMNNLTGDPGKEEGVVGVAPNTRVLSYKVCNSSGSCSDFAIQQGIARAIEDGAKVINMSLGSPDFSQSLANAVQDAWNAGLVVVAAAGNSGVTTPFYPAALPHVVSVGAYDEDHRRASFSNYGSLVDISAPGNWTLSTYPLVGCSGVGPPGDMGCYSWNSGTSMASPHVAGAAALILSRPDVTSASQAVDILLQSADPQGVDAVPLNSWTVHGGLNLHNAMSLGASNLPPVADAGPDQTVTDTNNDGSHTVSLDGSGSTDPDGTIATYEWRNGATTIAVGATPDVLLSVGSHTLTLIVEDDDGSTGTDSVNITVNPGNVAPVAANKNATTVVGTPVTVTLSATDAATCELAFSIVQGPSSGTLSSITNQNCVSGSPNADTAQVTYTPNAPGTHSFTYKVNDGSLDSNTATVTIQANDPPPATLAVTGIDPSSVRQNVGTLNFIISGAGFVNGSSVAFVNGTGGQTPRVLSVTFDSANQLTARVEIRSGGPKRNRTWDVRVTNPGGASATGVALLTITP